MARRQQTLPGPEGLSTRIRALSAQAATENSRARQVWSLWRIESLVFAVAERHPEQVSLRDNPLPLEAGPPAHCGLSMAAVLDVGFDPELLTARLNKRSHPGFVDFAYETLGLMLCAYESDLFGRITNLLGRIKLLRRHSLAACEPERFLAALPTPRRRLAAHGYGRLLYFKSHSIQSAVRAIRARPYLPFEAAVKGALAAYVLVNVADVDRILARALSDTDTPLLPELDGATADGLHNVLKLLEWSLPGCLANVQIQTRTSTARDLLSAAVTEAQERRHHGSGPGLVA